MITAETVDRSLLYNSSEPVLVNGVPVYPITIGDIRRMGYTRYRILLRLLCLTSDDVSAMIQGEVSNHSPFLFLLALLEFSETECDDIKAAFRMVCRDDITWDLEKQQIFCKGGFLTEEHFYTFQNIVKERNVCMESEADENPADERARQLLKRSKELEERRRKDRGEGDGVTLADLVSICAAKLKVHPDDVGKYDLYQLYDVLGRFKSFDDYDVNINALLHGAKKEDVDLSHWLSSAKSLFGEST